MAENRNVIVCKDCFGFIATGVTGSQLPDWKQDTIRAGIRVMGDYALAAEDADADPVIDTSARPCEVCLDREPGPRYAVVATATR